MKHLTKSVVLLAALSACGDQELILEGERFDLEGTAAEEVVNRAAPLALPAASVNAEWTHANGNARHQLNHPALGRELARRWSVTIGQGNDRKHRITANPVVAGGRIYTMDSRSTVSAHTTGGAAVWARDLTPASDNEDDASGGGLAVAGGVVFATTGFGELTALNAASGETIWVQDLDAASTGAPTVADGVVYVVTRDSIGWAIDAADGRILWQVFGATDITGIAGGPAPSVAGPVVIFPLASGQMVAAVAGTGAQTWAASVAGKRRGRAFSRYSDLSGAPVVVGNVVYASNHAGRVAAFDSATGQPIWRGSEGSISPVWVVGSSVFLVSDENRLIRLDASTGDVIWAQNLPFFTRERIKRRKATFAHYGPVLAGGRLLVVSDDGMLRQFDPVTGNLIAASELPGRAARNPVVAGGTLYIVTENGQLHALR